MIDLKQWRSSARINNHAFHSLLVVLAASFGAGIAVTRTGFSAREYLLIGNAMLMCFPFILGLFTKSFDVFAPQYLFAISFGILFVLRPIFDMSKPEGIRLFLDRYNSSGYTEALFIGFLGCFGFYIGYYSRFGRKLSTRMPALSGQWHSQTLVISIGLLLVVCLAVFYLFIRQLGGIGGFLAFSSGRSLERGDFLGNTSGYIYTAPLWLASVGILLLAICKSWYSLVGMTGVVLILVSQSTQIGAGGRSSFLPILISTAMMYYFRRNTRPKLTTILTVSFLGFLLLITLPRQYRNIETRESSIESAALNTLLSPIESVRLFFESLDTAMINALALVVQKVPTDEQYRFGVTYVDDLARPIPRALWPGKPVSGDEQIIGVTLPDFQERGIEIYASMFAEPYFNFGYIGVVVFCIAFGLSYRSLYEWFLKDQSNSTLQVIYAVNLPFIFVYLRGGVGVDYQRHAIALSPIILILLVAQIRERRNTVMCPNTVQRVPNEIDRTAKVL